MGVCTGVLTLLLPLSVLGIIPPSPVLPGPGPLPGSVPPVVIPIDHQRCVAMKREMRRIQVPVPFFCHPQDTKGIAIPQLLDQDAALIMMRLQWSGYKVCTRQVTLPTHRYIPVPVCCPGWQRGPSGKCDTSTFTPPPALKGPCLNGGILKKNGKCCLCPPGFTGALCQQTLPPTKQGSPFPAPNVPPFPLHRAQVHYLPATIRSRVTKMLELRERSRSKSLTNRAPPKSRQLPISPRIIKLLNQNRNTPVRPSPSATLRVGDRKPVQVPANTAFINKPPTKPIVNTASINKIPRRPQPVVKAPVNTAYINQLPRRNNAPRRGPTNIAHINQLPRRNNAPRRGPTNIAHINQIPTRNNAPRRGPTNIAHINQIPTRNNVPKRIPAQVAYINQMPKKGRVPPKIPGQIAYINRIPTRRVVRPPIVNTAHVNPYVNARPVRITVNTAHINQLPRVDPRRNRPLVNMHAINRILTETRRPIQPPTQTAHINRIANIPIINKRPPTLPTIPANSPRPVMAPPIVAGPRLGIRPMFNPTAINPVAPPVKSRPIDVRIRQGGPPRAPAPQRHTPVQPQAPPQNTAPVSSDAQCKQIIEIGITRCFRDAGILAGPRDIFNPQNPDVARSVCSQGKRLRPCILAGETACGRGMRVIITRRMLSTLINAIGNLCMTSQPLTPAIRKTCVNGGVVVNNEGQLTCECPQGFGGEMCEIPICIPACANNGVCQNIDGAAKCVCQSGFHGEQCENAIPVTTVTDPKPVDPPTHSLETSSNPVPVPVTKPRGTAHKLAHETNKEKTPHDGDDITHLAKIQIFGYPLWFVLAIILGFCVVLLVIFISCCMCLKCRTSKRSFEVNKQAVKLPIIDNVYTVGVVPSVYEAKGIPPLSYEEAKGETIRGVAKQLEKEAEGGEDCQDDEK